MTREPLLETLCGRKSLGAKGVSLAIRRLIEFGGVETESVKEEDIVRCVAGTHENQRDMEWRLREVLYYYITSDVSALDDVTAMGVPIIAVALEKSISRDGGSGLELSLICGALYSVRFQFEQDELKMILQYVLRSQ